MLIYLFNCHICSIPDGQQLEAQTTIHPEIVGRSNTNHVSRDSSYVNEFPDKVISSGETSSQKVDGQVCCSERREEVRITKEKESEEALYNGLVPAVEKVIYEDFEDNLMLGGSTFQELDLMDGQVTVEKRQEVSDGCLDNVSQEGKAKYMDKIDDDIIDSRFTQEGRGIDVDKYVCTTIVDLKCKTCTIFPSFSILTF